MKKLFAIIGISVMSFCAFLGGTKQKTYALYAEPETSQTSEQTISSETSQEPIDIDKETEQVISNTAKDVIEVIKTIFNQPIVIGGVSTTLGVLVVFIFGKLFGNYLSKRNNKYDKKITELLKKIGISEQAIETLKGELDKLEPIIKEIISNTKNIKVKEKLIQMYNEEKAIVEKVAAEEKEIIVTVEKNNQDAIKELLEK